MLVVPATASAACTNPSYPEGAQYYNSTYHVMQFGDGDDWVNMGAPNSGVEDGDKGDITVSSLGTAWAIDDAAVTNAMLAGSIALSKLAVTGTPDGSKFLKDDGSWAVPAANLSGGAAGYGAVWSSPSALTYDSALYMDTTNHRVGIGTTTPVYPLHVIGNARVQASSGAVYSDIVTLDTNNTYLRYSTGGSTRWVVGVDTADSNKYKLSSGVNDFSATKFTIDTSGNVGIGTATPGSKLSVNGTLDVADHITLSRPGGEFITKGSDTANYVMVSGGSAVAGANVLLYGSTHATEANVLAFRNSAERMRIDSSGNVGIGTTSPVSKLEVVGTATATTFSGSGAALNSLSASNLSSGTVATARLGTGTANNTTFLRGDGAWTAITEADPKVSTLTNGKWCSTNGSVITCTQDAPSAPNAAGSAGYVQFNGVANAFAGDSAFFWDNSNKRLGIGTTVPAEKLDIQGALIVRGGLASYASASGASVLDYAGGSQGSRWLAFGPDNATRAQIRIYQAAANNNLINVPLEITTSRDLLLAQSAGNVGIGTTSPASKFEVVGTATATTFSGSGASLTSLSGSNISSGTVATARLGSGTADSTTYLRGDGTWAAPSSSVPQGTWCGAATRDVSSGACTTGTYTSIATCNGSSVVSSCPSGYTHTNVSIFANDYCGEASCPKYYCTRTCIKN
jgi:hypothetical protein